MYTCWRRVSIKTFERSWCLNFRICLSVCFASASFHVLKFGYVPLDVSSRHLMCIVLFFRREKKNNAKPQRFWPLFFRYAISCASDSSKGADVRVVFDVRAARAIRFQTNYKDLMWCKDWVGNMIYVYNKSFLIYTLSWNIFFFVHLPAMGHVLGGGFKCFLCSSRCWGSDPIWRAFFFKGVCSTTTIYACLFSSHKSQVNPINRSENPKEFHKSPMFCWKDQCARGVHATCQRKSASALAQPLWSLDPSCHLSDLAGFS